MQQQAQRVDQNVPLLALDLLARIIPGRIDAGPPCMRKPSVKLEGAMSYSFFFLWLSATCPQAGARSLTLSRRLEILPVRGGACRRARNIAPQPCIRSIREDRNHDAVMRIGGEAPRRRTHSFSRHKGHRGARVAPPRMVIDVPSGRRAEMLKLLGPRAWWLRSGGRSQGDAGG